MMPVDKVFFDRNQLSQVQNACIIKNQKHENVYLKQFQVFRKNKKNKNKYHKVNVKLKKHI